MKSTFLRLAAVATVAVGASACSSVPDWVDPTTWGGDNTPPPTATADANAQSPDLADIPDRPKQTTTPDDQKQVAESLSADRTQANYSTEALRGGTENAAAPPEAASATQSAPSTASATSPSGQTEVAANEPAPASAQTDVSADVPASAPAPASGQTEVASNEPPPASAMAPPTTAVASAPMPSPGQMAPSDAALGFRSSTAPPLDGSVAQYVPATVMARYKQTASLTPETAGQANAPPADNSRRRRHRHEAAAEGGPEAMSGDVVANMDTLQSPEAAQPSTYSDASGQAPAEVVFFPGNGTSLNAAGRAKVKEAVAAYQANGGKGFIKVVGHSSSRTANMPVERHLQLIFQQSQERANAVAHELIKEGIPADKVLVEAVGDSQPVYYESMPAGEEGNRRAEIFLQS